MQFNLRLKTKQSDMLGRLKARQWQKHLSFSMRARVIIKTISLRNGALMDILYRGTLYVGTFQ